MADALGVPVTPSAEPEGSSRGAVLLASEALGLIPSLEAAPAGTRPVIPADPARHARYRARPGPAPAALRPAGAAHDRGEESGVHDGSRSRPALRQHDPVPGGRRRAAGEVRPSRSADGRGADGVRPVDALPAPSPGRSGVARSRPVRPVRRPRLDAALRAPPPHGLRPPARGDQALPPVGIEDARAPGVRRSPRASRRRPARSARDSPTPSAWPSPSATSPPGSTGRATPWSTTTPTCSARTATSWKASPRRRRRSRGTSGSAS